MNILSFTIGATQLATVLVPLEAQLTGCEIIMRVQSVITQEIPRRAVKLIGP